MNLDYGIFQQLYSKNLKEIGYNHFGKFIIKRKNSHKLGFIS
ncbi:hypothetical protein [Leptospira kirschneri]|uniref:Uncharacterized protein n=1 Tax=Leptospira kirschneri str. H1 TaxID=1049966 RepID=A0A0E2BGN8_9LEPT|nr:hypothetical protein [Leptospira kirschneri]EKO16367.1 hypothetical protein LEP1GSC081_4036 [Leptospira kirschneri str. H1]EKO60805.1 hypothetical protein LEP1GSC082_0940 [Leptospira kirschneri str. H2]